MAALSELTAKGGALAALTQYTDQDRSGQASRTGGVNEPPAGVGFSKPVSDDRYAAAFFNKPVDTPVPKSLTGNLPLPTGPPTPIPAPRLQLKTRYGVVSETPAASVNWLIPTYHHVVMNGGRVYQVIKKNGVFALLEITTLKRRRVAYIDLEHVVTDALTFIQEIGAIEPIGIGNLCNRDLQLVGELNGYATLVDDRATCIGDFLRGDFSQVGKYTFDTWYAFANALAHEMRSNVLVTRPDVYDNYSTEYAAELGRALLTELRQKYPIAKITHAYTTFVKTTQTVALIQELQALRTQTRDPVQAHLAHVFSDHLRRHGSDAFMSIYTQVVQAIKTDPTGFGFTWLTHGGTRTPLQQFGEPHVQYILQQLQTNSSIKQAVETGQLDRFIRTLGTTLKAGGPSDLPAARQAEFLTYYKFAFALGVDRLKQCERPSLHELRQVLNAKSTSELSFRAFRNMSFHGDYDVTESQEFIREDLKSLTNPAVQRVATQLAGLAGTTDTQTGRMVNLLVAAATAQLQYVDEFYNYPKLGAEQRDILWYFENRVLTRDTKARL